MQTGGTKRDHPFENTFVVTLADSPRELLKSLVGEKGMDHARKKEMNPPKDVLIGHFRDGPRGCVKETPGDFLVEIQDVLAEFGIGFILQASSQEYEILVFSPGAHHGLEEGVKDRFDGGGAIAGGRLGLVEQANTLPVQGPETALEHGLRQGALGTEVVVDGSQVGPGLTGDVPQGGGPDTPYGKQLLGCVEEPFPGVFHFLPASLGRLCLSCHRSPFDKIQTFV
jgi:hypothetical protein